MNQIQNWVLFILCLSCWAHFIICDIIDILQDNEAHWIGNLDIKIMFTGPIEHSMYNHMTFPQHAVISADI